MTFIGLRLKAARHTLKATDDTWTLEGVEERLNKRIRRNALAAYEQGKSMPPANKLAILADLYGKPAGWFLGEEAEPEWEFHAAKDMARLSSEDVREVEAFIRFKLSQRRGG